MTTRASALAGDALHTSSNGEPSCSSCHIFGDFDSLAWDLGNPDDVLKNNRGDSAGAAVSGAAYTL